MLSRCARTPTSSISTSTFRLQRSPSMAIDHGSTQPEQARGRAMNASRTIESDHGAVDAIVLAELRGSFAPSDLVAAVDRLDAHEGRQKWLRACLLRLHAMASHLINDTPQTVAGQEPIWQLAEEIGDELDAFSTSLSHITKLLDQLGRLRPKDDAPAGTDI